ncbi:MAG TPA: two-component regulator propeller domain-containing protein [Flavilitoribacter sp.]|nr:two-component regulator propeller domain-containing protein [Flavilitoribacter sp.]
MTAKSVQLLLFLFLFGSAISCEGQKEPARSQNPNGHQKGLEILNSEKDPYFVETEAISSPYGPTSITRNIMQDRNGKIWLATWEGIIQYDGKSFTNLTNKEGLRRFHVFSVLEDSKGNLWFGTIGAGVYRYDGKSFTNFTTREGLAYDNVISIYEDKSGNIWFSTAGGASCFDGKSFRNITTDQGLTNNDVNVVAEDKTGKFWFGTRGYACFYDGKTFTRFTNAEGAPFENVRSIIQDTKGNIWLGGNDGLWRYDGSSFTNFTKNFVGYIYEDSKGNIWTSSNDGNMETWVLSRYDALPLPSGIAPATRIKTEKGMYFGISEDRDGGIWLGTLNGVYRYDGKTFNSFKGD